MNCDMELHEGLIESGDIICPFCNQNLESFSKILFMLCLSVYHQRQWADRLSELWNRSRIQNGERIC